MSDFNFYEALQKLKKSGDTEAAARKEVGIKSDPWLIAKKSMLVDVPSSIVGLGGLLETFGRGVVGNIAEMEGIPIDMKKHPPFINQNDIAPVFANAAERMGWLPKDSLNIKPHGVAERAAGVATRVVGNPLTYLPGPKSGAITRNIVGGLSGESAAEAVSAQGGGGLAQAGAGFATDAATMLLSPRVRAGFMVNRMNLGPEGAKEFASELGHKLDKLTDAEKKAWRAYEQSTTGTTMPGDVLSDVKAHVREMTEDSPDVLRPGVANSPVPAEVDAAKLQRVRSAAIADSREAMGQAAPRTAVARNAGIIGDTADAMLDVIAQSSPADAASVAKLRAARGATRSRADLFPEESVLYRNFFGGKARDNASEAVTALLSSPQRETEVNRVLTALKDSPSGLRAFRRAFVQAVLKSPEELVSSTGAPALRKLDRFSDVSPSVLTQRGAEQLRKRLGDAARSKSPGSDATIALARVAGVPWSISNMVGGGAASAAAAMAAGLGPQSASQAGLAGAFVLPAIVYISEKFGPRAARDVAFEALLDPDLYAKVTRKVGNMTLPAYTKDLERAVVTRGLHLGIPDAPAESTNEPKYWPKGHR